MSSSAETSQTNYVILLTGYVTRVRSQLITLQGDKPPKRLLSAFTAAQDGKNAVVHSYCTSCFSVRHISQLPKSVFTLLRTSTPHHLALLYYISLLYPAPLRTILRRATATSGPGFLDVEGLRNTPRYYTARTAPHLATTSPFGATQASQPLNNEKKPC